MGTADGLEAEAANTSQQPTLVLHCIAQPECGWVGNAIIRGGSKRCRGCGRLESGLALAGTDIGTGTASTGGFGTWQ